MQRLLNPTEPFATNFVINSTIHPEFNVTDSRWLNDFITCVRPAGSTAACTNRLSGLSRDVRQVSQSGNTISINHSGSSINGNGFQGFNVNQTWTADQDVLRWTTTVINTSPNGLEFQDVGFPLLMDSFFQGDSTNIYEHSVERHSYIAEDGSYIYWGRPNGVGPYLLMTPTAGTSLEYKNKADAGEGPFQAQDPKWEGLQEFYVHSANVVPRRVSKSATYLPATSITVPQGGRQKFEFEFRWPSSYKAMHDTLYAAGVADIVSLPGMTVPTDIPITLAVRAQSGISSVAGEGGKNVQVTSQGTKNGYNVYTFSLPTLGPQKVTITYNGGRTSVMQYMSIKPVDQLVQSRTSFLVKNQQAKTSKGYNGAFLQWDFVKKALITWDTYPGGGWKQWMAGGSDDLGLAPAEFLSLKNTITPVQAEITSIDYYIDNFLAKYLQAKKGTNGARTWEVYRWYDGQEGTPSDTGTWRTFNYIHIANTYFHMYQVKRTSPPSPRPTLLSTTSICVIRPSTPSLSFIKATVRLD